MKKYALPAMLWLILAIALPVPADATSIGGTEYALFANLSIRMENGPVNITGNIAVNDPDGFIQFGSHNTVNGTATAHRITFASFTAVTTCEFDISTGSSAGCGSIDTPVSQPLPIVAWPPLGLVNVLPCVNTAPDLTVPPGGSASPDPGCYGAVRVRDNGTLNLSAGIYNFKNLRLEQGATLKGAGVDPTTVNAKGLVTTEAGVTIQDVTIKTQGSIGSVITIGVGSTVTNVLFYAPNGTIHLHNAGAYTGFEGVGKSIVVQPVTIASPPTPQTCIAVTKACTDATAPGGAIQFTGTVSNCGAEPLNNVTVVDDNGTPGNTGDDKTVLGPITLAVGESKPFSGSYIPGHSGASTDTVTATGTGATTSTPVSQKASATCNVPVAAPCIDVTKQCTDATSPGGAILFSGTVRNCGNEALNNVTVVDDNGTPGNTGDDKTVLGPTTLALGESKPFSGSYTPANSGQSTDTVTATGTSAVTTTSVSDKASATCQVPPPGGGDEGCTPGYWKQSQHFDSWVGHTTTDTAGSLFSSLQAACPALASKTLLQSLQGGGGPAFCDKVQILIRAAVAAVLNADNPNVAYPRTVTEIKNAVNTAINSASSSTVTTRASSIDKDNNLGCPLN